MQLPFRPEIYSEVLTFLRACLINSSGPLPALDELRNPQAYAPQVTRFLHNNSEVVQEFLQFGEQLMRATQGPSQAQFLTQVST